MKLRWSLTIFALLCAVLMSRAGQEPLQLELAQARAATALYHNVDYAIADGYVQVTGYVPGEGFHYANRSLIDGVFEIDRPEALLYTVGPNGQLRLAGVEYLVPLTLSEDAPEGFTGSDDVWRENSEGGGLWEMNAWLWLNNPDGMFAAHNPRIP